MKIEDIFALVHDGKAKQAVLELEKYDFLLYDLMAAIMDSGLDHGMVYSYILLVTLEYEDKEFSVGKSR